METILVVDDEESICWGVEKIAQSLGTKVQVAGSAEEALARPDLVPAIIVLDVRLPGINGLEAMSRFRERWGAIPIIVMTAFGDLETAVSAVRNGAFEFVIKPFSSESIRNVLQRALHYGVTTPIAAVASSKSIATADRAALPSVAGFVAKSPIMQEVFNRIALAANADAAVLVHGESGTGKELAARAIHQFSSRAANSFVVVNVAALTPTLAESELFGHVRGAFTGAEQNRVGLLAQAHRGTIFLDEIAEIPLPIQAKLLRALEQKEILPVGSNTPTKTDFRVVSATHQNLSELVKQSRFRHDLYFRIAAFQIEMPPLRDRVEDIVPLAIHFLETVTPSGNKPPRLSRAAEVNLQGRPWKGNVRELRNVIEHAVILSRGQTILPEHLPPPTPDMNQRTDLDSDAVAQIQELLRRWTKASTSKRENIGNVYEQLLQIVEPPVFDEILKANRGQLSNSAKMLGLHRTTLRRKADRYRLE